MDYIHKVKVGNILITKEKDTIGAARWFNTIAERTIHAKGRMRVKKRLRKSRLFTNPRFTANALSCCQKECPLVICPNAVLILF